MDNLKDRLYDAQACSPAQNYCRNRHVMEEAAQKIERLDAILQEFLEVSERAVRLSLEHSDFKLYAMEPMRRIIALAKENELSGNSGELK